jgi:hypothetical protein
MGLLGLLTASTPSASPQVSVIFAAGSIPGSSTREGPGQDHKSWPVFFHQHHINNGRLSSPPWHRYAVVHARTAAPTSRCFTSSKASNLRRRGPSGCHEVPRARRQIRTRQGSGDARHRPEVLGHHGPRLDRAPHRTPDRVAQVDALRLPVVSEEGHRRAARGLAAGVAVQRRHRPVDARPSEKSARGKTVANKHGFMSSALNAAVRASKHHRYDRQAYDCLFNALDDGSRHVMMRR